MPQVTVYFSMYYPPGQTPFVYPSASLMNSGPFVHLETKQIQVDIPEGFDDKALAKASLEAELKLLLENTEKQAKTLKERIDSLEAVPPTPAPTPSPTPAPTPSPTPTPEPKEPK